MTDKSQLDFSALPEGVVWTLVMEELRELKHDNKEYRKDTRNDIRRLEDKIDRLDSNVQTELKDHKVDITKLQTEVEQKARFAGAIAGFVASIVTALAGAISMYVVKSVFGG